MKYQSAQEVKTLLSGNNEIAFIDVRENADYGKGHPFFVSHVPYSILEARIGLYVPRFGTKIALIDNGDGVSEKAALRLEEKGYSDLLVVQGGISEWKAAGYALYEGISAPSKSFGEVVEHELGTRSITAKELKARMDAGDDNFLLLDGRTPEEFNRMTIPTSTSCPNAELGLRYKAMMARPDQDIIVNCAGRTRSLIGAQALNLLGLPNKIYALENGTMGWKLAGFELEHGATRSYPHELPDDVLTSAEAKAEELIKKYQLQLIDAEQVSSWKKEDRTIFMFDIRTAEEFDAGHPDGFRHAPGGQLVQATDQWFATRNARIVLFDQHKIRAAITAIWLRGMGHDAVLLDPASLTELVHIEEYEIDVSGIDLIDAHEIKQKMANPVTIVDIRSSKDYRELHIEDAVWSIRPKLDQINVKGDIIIIASELLTATYALKDLGGNGFISLTEPEDWKHAGLNLVSTPDSPPDEDRIDFLFHTHERHSGNMDHAREYLRWETGLIDQMDEQEKSTLNPLRA
jgi:rhodanese-related sulfurtransferase